MRKAIYPGSFDPLTIGHLDLIQRAAAMFDELEVVILHNEAKKSMFQEEERLEFIRNNTKELKNVICSVQNTLTVKYAKECGACAMIRGIRSLKDYMYEEELAQINQRIEPSIESVLLFCNPKYSTVSSSMIKELFKYGEDISDLVPSDVEEKLRMKLKGE